MRKQKENIWKLLAFCALTLIVNLKYVKITKLTNYNYLKKWKKKTKKTFLRNIDEDNFLLGISLNSLYIFFVVSKPQQQKAKSKQNENVNNCILKLNLQPEKQIPMYTKIMKYELYIYTYIYSRRYTIYTYI